MKHTLNVTIEIEDDFIVTTIEEPGSGETAVFDSPLSIDEHHEYDSMLGTEIYSWISLWADEEEKIIE